MTALLMIAPGVLMAVGLLACVVAFRPRHPRLADALGALDAAPVPAPAPAASGVERLGEWWVRVRGVAADEVRTRQLALSGRSLTRHYALKLVGAGVGFALPIVLGTVLWLTAGVAPTLPWLLSLAGLVIGFVLPDLLLRGAGKAIGDDAGEALLTYFDLVTLERLANRSAIQSLHAAAELSDTPVFRSIRRVLDRARLEQRAPYADLKVLARELDLPALADLADVMRLDESGASLAVTLRARVRELRDAHLTRAKVAATQLSERMTVWMVLPSLVLGLFFLVPPLLTLASSG